MFYYGGLDVEKMSRAGKAFVGEWDFAGFCSAGAQVQTTVRKIYDLQVERAGELVRIRVEGNGFLYNMVRIIAGTLLEVGKGKIPPERMGEIIIAKDRSLAGPTAPAKGLRLVEIRYNAFPLASAQPFPNIAE